uniref:Sugar phosphate transporter domain-containing protein n=1 Tax=Pavo cristatus TaxID=9049 RepID=A0A8C9G5Z0_PAVCR
GAGPAAGRPGGAALALPRVLSAVFYGTCSFLIVLVNKGLLSAYRFPSPIFLGIGQMAATILILYVSKLNKIIHFPDFEKSIPRKLTLPLIYAESLPLFTVLRKFTIPLTLLLEVIILGKLIWIISLLMLLGVKYVFPRCDLSFNLEGYTFVLLNDIFTAANGVYTKQKMDPNVPVATHFQQWTDFLCVFQFLLSCFLGFLLMYSTVLCSHYNSALKTAVVGAIKNISIAYIGMLIGGDYMFSVLNFIGLNICMAGGLRYSFLTLRGNIKPAQPEDEENVLPESKC